MDKKDLQVFIDELRKKQESDKTDSHDIVYVTQGYIRRPNRKLKINNINNEEETSTKKE